MNKKYSIDKGCAQASYVSPEVKMIELKTRNAILESSPGSTLEGGKPQFPATW